MLYKGVLDAEVKVLSCYHEQAHQYRRDLNQIGIPNSGNNQGGQSNFRDPHQAAR